jgi:hypothetical protein
MLVVMMQFLVLEERREGLKQRRAAIGHHPQPTGEGGGGWPTITS